MAEVLVSALREQVAPSSLPSACAALKSIAVNVSFATIYFFLKKMIIFILLGINNFCGDSHWQVWDLIQI